jgi:hypothetical protein
MRRILKNFIFMALFLSVGTNLPEIQFSMAQVQIPSVDEAMNRTKYELWKNQFEHEAYSERDETLSCNKAGSRKMKVEVEISPLPIPGYSGDCLAELSREINRLTANDFFTCIDDEQVCGKDCDCEAYIDNDCNYAVGGQTPRNRCIYRSPSFPFLYQGLDIMTTKLDSIKCGFWVEAKGGCKCVQKVITRTDSEKEPVTLDQQ